jgi:hypothetical protein
MKNEEEQRKFEAKWTSDEEVTSKTMKPGTRVIKTDPIIFLICFMKSKDTCL